MKKIFLISLAVLGLETVCFNGYAGSAKENPLLQYVEKDDNVILYEDVEEISFSKKGNSVSANHNVQKTFKNLRGPEVYYDFLYYNDEFSPLKIYSEESVYSVYSSNMDEDGVFFDGMNNCLLKMDFHNNDWTCGYKYNQEYPIAIFLSNYFFQERLFVAKKVLKIEVPTWLDMEIKEYAFDGTIQKTVEHKSKSTIFTYTMNHVKKPKEEKNSPSMSAIAPNLLFLYKSMQTSKGEVILFKTAQNQYEWYRNLLAQNQEDEASVGRMTKSVVANCKTNKEKISAIYAWVQQNIRYIAIENSINGFKPQTAITVMENKYGDCKGMANLLKYMLKSEGVDARMAWLSNDGRVYDYSTPSLSVDNHAICAAILGKDTIYLDATCEYASLHAIPCSIEGRPVMVENGEKCIITHVPANQPSDNLDSSFVALRIVDNQLKGTFRNVRGGEDKELLLSARDEDFEDDKAVLKSLRYPELPVMAEEVEISDAKASDPEITVSYPITLPNYCHAVGNEYLVSMEYRQPYRGGVIDLKDRKTDLCLPYKNTDVFVTELTIPTGYKVAYVPSDWTIDKPKYRFEIRYVKKGNKIIYSRRLIFKERIVPLAEIPSWNKDVEALKAAYAEMVILKK